MIVWMDDDPKRAALAHQRMTPEKRDRTMWAMTAEATIEILANYADVLEEVHLDHDLGGARYVNSDREDCGMEVVRWLERLPTSKLQVFLKCKFIVHTWNIPAGQEMEKRLKDLGLKAEHVPFGTHRW